jgi:hypothetical protein
MGAEQHTLASNAFAWFLNVSSAVTIVFVNKVLMDHKKGYAFTFGGCLAHSVC